MLNKLQHSATQVGELIEQFRFAEASELVYHAVWDDFADWYIEASKVAPNKPLLAYALETILRLVHPFAPFVTETIWQALKWEESLLINAEWPTANIHFDREKAHHFDQIKLLVKEVRYIQAELGVRDLPLLHKGDALLTSQQELVNRLARVSVQEDAQAKGMHIAHPSIATWLSVDEETLQGHITRLEDRLLSVEAHLVQLHGRLENPSYVNNAPAHIVQQTKDEAESQSELKKRLAAELEAFQEA